MTTENLGLFQAMSSKMKYLEQRHRVIAQNIANADTPAYEPKDLKPVDFSTVMKKVTSSQSITPNTTQAGHMVPGGNVADPKQRDQRQVYEVAPAGNAVILEEQILNATENNMDYSLMTSIYQKNIGMIRTALGTNK